MAAKGAKRVKGDFGMNEWLFVILTIIVAVIALLWGLGRLDFSGGGGGSFGGAGASGSWSDSTIVFSQVENRVSAGTLDAYLEKNAGDKLKGKGGVFYSLGEKYDIDPAFAVAVAQKETSLGKKTCQGISQDCNNFFCIKASGNQADCSGWARYSGSEQGIEAFYSLIKNSYVDSGQDTIAEIGCAPGSGYSSHCYCVGKATPYCTDWVGGASGVPSLTGSIRDYAA